MHNSDYLKVYQNDNDNVIITFEILDRFKTCRQMNVNQRNRKVMNTRWNRPIVAALRYVGSQLISTISNRGLEILEID